MQKKYPVCVSCLVAIFAVVAPLVSGGCSGGSSTLPSKPAVSPTASPVSRFAGRYLGVATGIRSTLVDDIEYEYIHKTVTYTVEIVVDAQGKASVSDNFYHDPLDPTGKFYDHTAFVQPDGTLNFEFVQDQEAVSDFVRYKIVFVPGGRGTISRGKMNYFIEPTESTFEGDVTLTRQ